MHYLRQHALLITTFALLAGCSHSEFRPEVGTPEVVKPDAEPMHTAANPEALEPVPSPPPPDVSEEPIRSKCLNIQDGDWHIEFSGRRLLLGDSGARPKVLTLDHDQRVTCEKLALVKNSRKGSVVIEYTTDQKGTSIGVSDRLLGVASVHDAKWIVEPILLARSFDANDQVETREYAVALWSTDKDGKAVLIITDSKTGQSQTFRP